jgi:glyoxylase-like metal-dependent hydrolase (beta-lactamase superfamily II)
MRVIRYNLGPLDNNTYLMIDDDSAEAAIVDPSFDSRFLWDEIRSAGWHLRYVLNTHAHIDHVVENAYFVRESGAPLALHPEDQPLLDAMEMQAAWLGMPAPEVVPPTIALRHGDEIALGSGVLKVVHTPGHSPGHVSFLGPDFAIVADVLFRGSIGRTDLPGGNYEQLIASIERELLVLSDDTVVYPGHGETTTIGDERRDNPFLSGLR